MDQRNKRILGGVIAGVVALCLTYSCGKEDGLKEGQDEYATWSSNRAANGYWKFIANCVDLFNGSRVEWDKRSVRMPVVEENGRLDQLEIHIPNFDQVNQAKPQPSKKLEERAKRLQEALCIENNRVPDEDEQGKYYGTAYLFYRADGKVHYSTVQGRTARYYIPPTADPGRSIQIITPQQKSPPGTRKTAEAFADFFFPDNKGVEREN